MKVTDKRTWQAFTVVKGGEKDTAMKPKVIINCGNDVVTMATCIDDAQAVRVIERLLKAGVANEMITIRY